MARAKPELSLYMASCRHNPLQVKSFSITQHHVVLQVFVSVGWRPCLSWLRLGRECISADPCMSVNRSAPTSCLQQMHDISYCLVSGSVTDTEHLPSLILHVLHRSLGSPQVYSGG